jgi:hypothetical protein
VETTLSKEPPPKPPEHIVDKTTKLDIASSQPNEGESKDKTIAELTSMHISKFEEDHNGKVDKEGYYIDNMFLDIKYSGTYSVMRQVLESAIASGSSSWSLSSRGLSSQASTREPRGQNHL